MPGSNPNSSLEPAGFGLQRDLGNLRRHGGATLAELREFMNSLKGKSPQEVLGAIAQGQFTQSLVIATLGCAVLLAACTIGPWWWAKSASQAGKPAAPGAAAAQADKTAPSADSTRDAQPAAAAVGPAASDAAARSNPAAAAPPASSTGDDILDKLDLNATKSAKPTENPLENSADDLLKDLK